MDERHSITSGRPAAETLNHLLYDNDEIILMQASDPRWRTAREYLNQNFMSTMVEKTHMELINAEAVQMYKYILDKPQNFTQHFKRFVNSFMMSVGRSQESNPVRNNHNANRGH